MTNYATPGMGTFGSTWQHAGYSGCGNVEGLLGSSAGRSAIICGNAEGVFEEYTMAKAIYPDALTYAVNDVGMYLPTVDHWVSLHAAYLWRWKAVRWQNPPKGSETARTWLHSMDTAREIDYVWDQLNPFFALSGYLAMQLAWLMGCAPIVLCGCPGMPQRRFFDVEPKTFGYGGTQYPADVNLRKQVEQEMRRLPEFKAVVRSMSGWTRDYFGGV